MDTASVTPAWVDDTNANVTRQRRCHAGKLVVREDVPLRPSTRVRRYASIVDCIYRLRYDGDRNGCLVTIERVRDVADPVDERMGADRGAGDHGDGAVREIKRDARVRRRHGRDFTVRVWLPRPQECRWRERSSGQPSPAGAGRAVVLRVDDKGGLTLNVTVALSQLKGLAISQIW